MKPEHALPWIGLYAAIASIFLGFLLILDLMGIIRNRKNLFTPRWFQLNAATLTILAVAIKLPVDLTTKMHDVEDYLSKVTGNMLISIAVANFTLSISDMEPSSIFSNVVALAILVITAIVNICIQISSSLACSFFLFYVSIVHVVVMSFTVLFLLILALWAMAVPAIRRLLENDFIVKYNSLTEEDHGNVGMVDNEAYHHHVLSRWPPTNLEELLKRYWLLALTRRPMLGWLPFHILSLISSTFNAVAILILLFLWMGPTIPSGDKSESDYKGSTKVILYSQAVIILVDFLGRNLHFWFLGRYIQHNLSEDRSMDMDTIFHVVDHWKKEINDLEYGFILSGNTTSYWKKIEYVLKSVFFHLTRGASVVLRALDRPSARIAFTCFAVLCTGPPGLIVYILWLRISGYYAFVMPVTISIITITICIILVSLLGVSSAILAILTMYFSKRPSASKIVFTCVAVLCAGALGWMVSIELKSKDRIPLIICITLLSWLGVSSAILAIREMYFSNRPSDRIVYTCFAVLCLGALGSMVFVELNSEASSYRLPLIVCIFLLSLLVVSSAIASIRKMHSSKRPSARVSDLERFVLQKDGVSCRLDIMCSRKRDVEKWIEQGKKNKPIELMTWIQKTLQGRQVFGGLARIFDSHVPSLVADRQEIEEPENCWVMPIVTLASIAMNIPGASEENKKSLRKAIRQGLRYVRFIEHCLDSKGLTCNARKEAELLWKSIEFKNKWYDEDIQPHIPNADAKQKLEHLANKGKEQFERLVRGLGRNYAEWPGKAIAWYTMYKIAKTIQRQYYGHAPQDITIFTWISEAISDTVIACISNLPRAIYVQCTKSDHVDIEEKIRNAAFILGETIEAMTSEHILLPIFLRPHDEMQSKLDDDRRPHIDEWIKEVTG